MDGKRLSHTSMLDVITWLEFLWVVFLALSSTWVLRYISTSILIIRLFTLLINKMAHMGKNKI